MFVFTVINDATASLFYRERHRDESKGRIQVVGARVLSIKKYKEQKKHLISCKILTANSFARYN